MINKEAARNKILDTLNPHPELSALDDELGIDSSVFYETKYSWIFCCKSRRHIETGNNRHALLGIHLVAVEKATGQVYLIGTGYSDRVLIALHESVTYPTAINRLKYHILLTLYFLGIQL